MNASDAPLSAPFTSSSVTPSSFPLTLLASIIAAPVAPQSVLHHLKLLYRPHVNIAMLTQSEGKLIEPLQFCHQGADCVPGLLLKSEVAGVLDGLWAGDTGREPQMFLHKK